jgi:hypothetical protein
MNTTNRYPSRQRYCYSKNWSFIFTVTMLFLLLLLNTSFTDHKFLNSSRKLDKRIHIFLPCSMQCKQCRKDDKIQAEMTKDKKCWLTITVTQYIQEIFLGAICTIFFVLSHIPTLYSSFRVSFYCMLMKWPNNDDKTTYVSECPPPCQGKSWLVCSPGRRRVWGSVQHRTRNNIVWRTAWSKKFF